MAWSASALFIHAFLGLKELASQHSFAFGDVTIYFSPPIVACCFLLPAITAELVGSYKAGCQGTALQEATGQRRAGTAFILFPLQWSSNRDL